MRLADFWGIVLGDCYSGYKGIALASNGRIRRAPCAAHARRKFIEAKTVYPLESVVAYKVYVADGREEPFRGCELGQIRVTELKRISAAGEKQRMYNVLGAGGFGGSSATSTIVAPAVLFPEIELAKSEEEHDKPPILKPPVERKTPTTE